MGFNRGSRATGVTVKEYGSSEIRNVGLIGHGSVGKTSLAEAMLFTAGASNRLGKVDDGTTLSDYSQDEIERKISISASMLHCERNGNKLNIIDTPGYADFIGEVVGALRAVDGAVLVINAVSGIEVGTEKVWQYAKDYGIGCLIVLNRMGKENADFEGTCDTISNRFGREAIPLQIPLNPGDGFNGLVDVLKMKLLTYPADGSKQVTEGHIPPELKDRASEFREKLVEAVAESDDDLLEKYLEETDLSDEELILGLRKGIATRSIFPILCTDAYTNVGTSALLDIISDCMPSPVDVGTVTGTRPGTDENAELEASESSPLSSLLFKTMSEPHVGELSLIRLYSGTLKSGDEVLNSSKGVVERIGQIYNLNGRDRNEIGNVTSGDMIALVKLKDSHTGDTLCNRESPVILPKIDLPEPVINEAVELKSKGDEQKISAGLSRLHEEDPTFVAKFEPELRQMIVSGQGELHLEVVINKLKQKFGVDVTLVEPKIPYRETITGKSQAQHRYKKQSGGRGQYGDVHIRIEPVGRGKGFEFVNEIRGGAIPAKYIPSVEKGIVEAMGKGILAGYPAIDFKVGLYDGTYHSVDSSDLAFSLAGSMAFQEAFMSAKPILLEPIYDVEVTVPEEFMGDVMGDLSSRRAKIQGMDTNGNFQTIRGQVPLAELYKYSTALRSMTQGRGLHTRMFSHYEPVPHELSEKVIADAKRQKEEG